MPLYCGWLTYLSRSLSVLVLDGELPRNKSPMTLQAALCLLPLSG